MFGERCRTTGQRMGQEAALCSSPAVPPGPGPRCASRSGEGAREPPALCRASARDGPCPEVTSFSHRPVLSSSGATGLMWPFQFKVTEGS